MQRYAQVITHIRTPEGTQQVEVEAFLSQGLPITTILGVPSSYALAARERVRAAIRASGFSLSPCRVTVQVQGLLGGSCEQLDTAIAAVILRAYQLVPTGCTEVPSGMLRLNGQVMLEGGSTAQLKQLLTQPMQQKDNRLLLLEPSIVVLILLLAAGKSIGCIVSAGSQFEYYLDKLQSVLPLITQVDPSTTPQQLRRIIAQQKAYSIQVVVWRQNLLGKVAQLLIQEIVTGGSVLSLHAPCACNLHQCTCSKKDKSTYLKYLQSQLQRANYAYWHEVEPSVEYSSDQIRGLLTEVTRLHGAPDPLIEILTLAYPKLSQGEIQSLEIIFKRKPMETT